MRIWVLCFSVLMIYLSKAQYTLNDFRIETVSYFNPDEFEFNFIEKDSIHYLDDDSIWQDYNYNVIRSVDLGIG